MIVGHFTRIYATWSGVLLPADCQALDQEASQAINGDDGGTWAPFEQIEFSGATNGLEVLGPVVVFQGPNSGTPGSLGFLATQGPGAPLFKYVGPGFPKLVNGHAGQTRTLPTLLAAAVATPSFSASPAIVGGACNGGIQTYAGAYSEEAGTITQVAQGALTSTGVELVAELRVHNGATLSEVALNFMVPLPHAAVPTLPKARILRVDVNGNATPLTSTASGADGAGYVSPAAPSSGAAWYNLGAAQSWTIPCDQNNVVDITQYYYVIDIVEEQTGTVVPVLAPVDACTPVGTAVNPTGAGTVTIDGRTVTAGNRYLLTHQANQRQNGPWIAQVGAWARPDDWQFGTTGGAYTLVPIQNGTTFAGTQQQLQGGAAVETIGGYPVWAPVHSYAVGQIVVPTAEVGWAYVCIVPGVSSNADPTGTWPTGPGAQVTDGATFSPWQPTTVYATNATVIPTSATGMGFTATTGGTSSGTQPTWPNVVGGTVTDGTVVWTAFRAGPITWSCVKDPSSPAAFGAPTPLGNIWLSAVGTFTGITTLAFQ